MNAWWSPLPTRLVRIDAELSACDVPAASAPAGPASTPAATATSPEVAVPNQRGREVTFRSIQSRRASGSAGAPGAVHAQASAV